MDLLRDYEALGRTFDRDSFLRYWQEAAERWIRQFRDDTACIAVMGARAGDRLLATLESALPYRIADLTCGGLRYLDAAPENGAALPLETIANEKITEIPEEGSVTRIYLKGAFWGIAERKEDRLVWRAQIPPEEKA